MSHPDDAPSPEPVMSRRAMLLSAIGGVLAVALVATVIVLFTSGGSDEPTAVADQAGATAPPAVGGPAPVGRPAELPESTTHDTVDVAPLDDSMEATDGTVVHPREEVLVHDAPDGAPIARIGPQQVGDTWLPVIDEQPGWVRVLLPSRPNGSSGWLSTAQLDTATTPYVIRVHLESMTLELIEDGAQVGEWTIGIGKASAPTPTGRTFLLGSFTDPRQDYSPVILPLGTHSPTLDSFGGGPGTVAIHTWPTTEVFGQETSDGCIRVPQDALTRLTEVPLGTLVIVDDL